MTRKIYNEENELKARILVGPMQNRLKLLPDSSVDSVVCDPPYGLGFMGKGWDATVPPKDICRAPASLCGSMAQAFRNLLT